jgi:hypothetical protein
MTFPALRHFAEGHFYIRIYFKSIVKAVTGEKLPSLLVEK